MIKAIALLALLAGMSAAGVKYVAVVETDVDAASGASADINPAEVRQVTAELRRQAAKNLPPDRYSVMTSETVQSMGGAVLEECADENCVITLGSRIGADYIVRGIISKFGTKLTLLVELYETDNGTLVISSEPVRAETKGELLEMATEACGNMYREFAGVKESARKSKANVEPKAVAKKSTPVTIEGRKFDYYFAPKYQQVITEGADYLWFGGNLEGGLVWGNGMFAGVDFGVGYYDNEFAGGGVSFGNVYDFGNQLQLVYGGSVGIWYGHYHDYYYYGYGDEDDCHKSYNFLAPFIKLRWKFVELTYRGLVGWKDVYRYIAGSSYNDFSYNHQLMLGLYFSTTKRER